ncbi:PiggyBac transposable element-derived protein 4-like [Plakobranchus ocellatus]|uniref:PiggyBac transposable element-derived protein 4-like n=1 Tax=Plakobranchus ocellatus TaxID=259542 RepID=A0AAV3Y145_9GAST|nr:PiggyBac transposable element-derived protein 4-like [Plakobranchus ocellatus]
MVGFTRRLSFKQYIKGKPTPWGIKIWCLAESETGYLLNFHVYIGKDEAASAHGQGYDVVMSMVQPYLGNKHVVFFDNFFSSPHLALDLLRKDTYCCGAIRPNRKGWPYPKSKQRKGEAKTKQSGLIVATQWTDKRQINVISTSSNPTMATVSRRTKAGPVNVEIPQPVHDYNSGMFGVDLNDQHRSY